MSILYNDLNITGTLHTRDPLKQENAQLRRELDLHKNRQNQMAGTMGAMQKYINRLKKRLAKYEPEQP